MAFGLLEKARPKRRNRGSGGGGTVPNPLAGATRALGVNDKRPAGIVNPDRTGYAQDVPPGGLTEINASFGASTQTDRKSQLLEMWEAYLACPWAWACVQAIARTVTSGGIETEWDGDDDHSDPTAPPKPPEVQALDRLIEFCNPTQDIRQLLRNAIADLLVFGDAFIEVVWWGTVPVALFNQDSPTTTPIADEHGEVSKYVQVTDYGKRAEFAPRQIIHISLDAARPGVFGTPPMQAALGSVEDWLFAKAVQGESFRKGLPGTFHADFPSGSQEPVIRKWRDQYRTLNLGARNIGTPIITKGNVKLTELQTGKIDSVISAKDQLRGEIFASFGVPPAKATVIESGNLGGGTGDAQDKTYRLDTCDPIGFLVLEKLNFHLTRVAFKIDGWHLKFPQNDYRDSKLVEDIRDERVRNGTWTRNRAAADIGEPPVEGGDDAMLVLSRSAILYKDLAAMSAQAAQGGPPQIVGAPGVQGMPGIGGQPPPGQDPGQPGSGAKPGQPGQPPQPAGGKGKKGGKPQAGEATARAIADAYYQNLTGRRTLTTEALIAEDAGSAVYRQLAKRFPAGSIAWAKDADWTGPAMVKLSAVDTSDRDQWTASADPGKVTQLRKALRKHIEAGTHPKPAVLVETPGGKTVIADGHHHFESAEAEGQASFWAYTGKVDSDRGDWDTMATKQGDK